MKIVRVVVQNQNGSRRKRKMDKWINDYTSEDTYTGEITKTIIPMSKKQLYWDNLFFSAVYILAIILSIAAVYAIFVLNVFL